MNKPRRCMCIVYVRKQMIYLFIRLYRRPDQRSRQSFRSEILYGISNSQRTQNWEKNTIRCVCCAKGKRLTYRSVFKTN